MDENPQLRIDDRTDRLVLAGEIDIGSAPRLQAALAEHRAGKTDVVLDVTAVSFMDSSGLRVLIELHQQVDTVTLIDPSSTVSRLLELTGTDEVFTIVRS